MMKTMFNRLFREETGAIISAEIILLMSILVIGVIVGLKSLRDSIVTELADVAQALANISQSYSYSATSGHHAFTGGGAFFDRSDFCDCPDNNSDAGNSKCVLICSAPMALEGSGGHGHGGHGGHGGGW